MGLTSICISLFDETAIRTLDRFRIPQNHLTSGAVKLLEAPNLMDLRLNPKSHSNEFHRRYRHPKEARRNSLTREPVSFDHHRRSSHLYTDVTNSSTEPLRALQYKAMLLLGRPHSLVFCFLYHRENGFHEAHSS